MNQVADHVARVEKVPVLFFAYEQGSEELLVKSLSRLTAEDWPGVDCGAIQKPWLADWERVRKAEADYARGPGRFLRIVDAGPEHTVEKIRLLANMAKRREDRRRAEAGTADADKPSVLLVIDYLQQVPAVNPLSGREFQSARERIDFILAALRRLSRELQAPILVLTSLNRAGYDLPKDKSTGRLSGPPELTVFKESGGIEYSADAAFCMGEDEVASREDIMHNASPDRDRPEGRRVFLFCVKNRNGRRVTLQADFYPAFAQFRNVEEARGMTA
jgi:replicative DNA helicase